MMTSGRITVDGVEIESWWVTPTTIARLHVLRAHTAPIAVVVRRKPSRVFHIIKWHTDRDVLSHGSWFRGTIYAHRCDLSWDGRYMVYLAMGTNGQTWNGVCMAPWLRTLADCENVGTWAGGGVFTKARTLEANTCWYAEDDLSRNAKNVPFRIVRKDSGGETFPILAERLARDGWQRAGDHWGEERELRGQPRYMVATVGDDGWYWQPTRKHPKLRAWYRGYFERGYTFEFGLEGLSGIIGVQTDWATWDARGNLLVAECGTIRRFSLSDLDRGEPSFEQDLESLAPPPRSLTADVPGKSESRRS